MQSALYAIVRPSAVRPSVTRVDQSKQLCDCMWDSFDTRERTICGIATVTGGRGAVA